MLEIQRDKPTVINNVLPAEITMTFEPEVPDEIKLELWDVKKKQCYGVMPLVRKEDACSATFLIEKKHACLGAAIYLLRVWDGCHCCDELQLRLSRECFVSSVAVEQAKGDCC